MLSIKNLSEEDLKETENILKKFIPYAQKQLGYNQPVKLMFISDPDNAVNPLGKTAHYQPGTKAITVYVDDRHPKDIMRSVSHELVHHAQNCRGEFDKTAAMGEGYAQADEHLREMEREAYEKGNLIFRDFTDGLKSNDEEITIYIDDSTDNESVNLHEEKKMKKNKFGLKSPHPKWQAFLLDEGSDNQKQQWMLAFQNAAGNPQPPPQDFWDTATYLYSKGGDPTEAGEQYAANHLSEGDSPKKDMAATGKDSHWLPEGDSPKKDMAATGKDSHWLPESYGEDDYGEDNDYFDALEAEFPFLSKAVKAGEVPEEVAVEIAKEYGSKEDMPRGEELKQSLREIVKRSMSENIEKLSGDQEELDQDKDGDIGADDLADLRSKKNEK